MAKNHEISVYFSTKAILALRHAPPTNSRFKVPMKRNFCPRFYSKILKSMILEFVISEFGLWTSANEHFFLLRSWPI